MLTYSIMKPEGILLLRPSTPLSKADFGGLSADVDAYLSEHAKLHGVMVQAKGFPGWEDFSGFTAHMHFVREHHKQVERIAVVTDSPWAAWPSCWASTSHRPSSDILLFPTTPRRWSG